MNKPDSWVEDILQKVKKPALADLFPSDSRKDLIEPLIELQKHAKGEYERALIALSFGWFKDEKAKPALLDSYENRAGAERRAAAASLGILGDARGRGEIIAALKDPNEYIRLNAVWALATLGGPEDARALTDALFYEKPTEKPGESGQGSSISNPFFRTRWQILRALAALQNPSSLPAIKTLLDQSKDYFMENMDSVISVMRKQD
jgi:HEAT repeat protein